MKKPFSFRAINFYKSAICFEGYIFLIDFSGAFDYIANNDYKFIKQILK